jgi:hypothetical protein
MKSQGWVLAYKEVTRPYVVHCISRCFHGYLAWLAFGRFGSGITVSTRYPMGLFMSDQRRFDWFSKNASSVSCFCITSLRHLCRSLIVISSRNKLVSEYREALLVLQDLTWQNQMGKGQVVSSSIAWTLWQDFFCNPSSKNSTFLVHSE